MDPDREKLLTLLYPDGHPENFEYNPALNDYLTKIGNYKIEDIIKEPQKLLEEQHNIEDQTQEVTITNYRTFIETAQCSKKLSIQFNSIEKKLDQLLVDAPNFEHKCQEFSEKSSGISNLRKLNSLTLTKNTQLLEILELPQLMNSFINDRLYDDALELAAYVRKMGTKFPDIPIFMNILQEVNEAWYLMLHQLLSQLRQDLTLPKCLEIVGFLRRMEVFTEVELRLKFLQARKSWLEQCIKYIPEENRNHHLTKTIELTRVNLFNIITQFRAVFTDDSVSAGPGKSDFNQKLMFYSWIHDRISDFLITLEDDLKYISSLESIMEQCMYFGLSFSKVGCDFRPLLVPIFTNQIFENFSNSISKAMINFEGNIERFTLINKHLPNIPWKSKENDPLHPPDSLLEFYPLAEYLNHVLKTLNGLRLYAPIAIIDRIVNSIQKSLIFIAKSLLILYSQEHLAFSNYSKDAFTRLCMCFADDLIPHIQKCVHIIYPPNQIANIIGVSLQVLQEEKISFLDRELVVEPIKHLLPQKIEPVLNFDRKDDKQNKVEQQDEKNDTTSDENQIEKLVEDVKNVYNIKGES